MVRIYRQAAVIPFRIRSERVETALMRVTIMLDHWLESRVRMRRWTAIDKAAAFVGTELHSLIHSAEGLCLSGRAHFRGPMTGPLRKEAHS